MDSLSLISAAVAVGGAVLTALSGYWQQRRLSSMEQRTYMSRYGGSLAWAAYDLQTRLFNILHSHRIDQDPARGDGFLTAFLVRGSARDAEFVRRSTVFVLAEYLGWVEILRRDIQFLDLGRNSLNTRIMRQIAEVGHCLAAIDPASSELRLFRARQRAVGELMVHPDSEPGRRRCLGFAEFCERLDGDSRFAEWFEVLLADVDRLAADTAPAAARLRALQTQLVVLIDLLDPKQARFPKFRLAFDPAIDAPGAPPSANPANPAPVEGPAANP
ncbi:hypothetical protein [Actinacidiphila yeochonensis]|uniref:hypothetical protein n=1 Tax=Actinacidiphila yeochonensis TaxID=89050 RepID=UPI000AE56806|nr:hypothetical protein [Actinacidiphila yeochonensis]